MASIGIIDCGSGNLTSVRNALHYLDIRHAIVRHPEHLSEVSHMILPGVGAFASAMRNLERHNFLEELRVQVVARKKPLLGICIGMQVLASVGHEFEEHAGLALIEGDVVRIESDRHGLRVPHMGWNEVNLIHESPLFKNLEQPPTFYFVHSYHLVPSDKNLVVGTATYGEEIVVAIQRDNVYGVQFHPEKSQQCGLHLLKNFAAL